MYVNLSFEKKPVPSRSLGKTGFAVESSSSALPASVIVVNPRVSNASRLGLYFSEKINTEIIAC